MMHNVWVTGAAGFLGKHVARRFLEDGACVAGLGRTRPSDDELARTTSRVRGSQAFVAAPVATEALESLLDLVGPPSLIVHAAGSGAVGPSLTDPLSDFERTTVTTAVVLDFLRRHAPQARFVLPSSAAVYGNGHATAIPEGAPCEPFSPYGSHKQAAEILCRSAQRHFGIRCTVIRFFSLYGAGQRKQLFWDVARRLGARPPILAMQGSGREQRDFLHVEDATRLVRHLAGRDQAEFEIINGGTGRATSVGEVARLLVHHVSPETDVTFNGQTRAGDPLCLVADTTLAEHTGFRPAVSIEEGVKGYVDWLRRNGDLT